MKINDEKLVYWLGFFWADGHIRKHGRKHAISMEIQEGDAKILETVFNLAVSPKQSTRTREGRLPTVCFRMSDKALGLFLEGNDYLEKSREEPSKILRLIPEKLHYFWWRGFFDGDGCISFGRKSRYKSLSISGRYDYEWKEFSNLLNKLKIKFKIRRSIGKTGRNSKVEIFRYEDIDKFFSFIYKNRVFDFGLRRKFEKFLELKNRQVDCF